jgi:hypothetical protein
MGEKRESQNKAILHTIFTITGTNRLEPPRCDPASESFEIEANGPIPIGNPYEFDDYAIQSCVCVVDAARGELAVRRRKKVPRYRIASSWYRTCERGCGRVGSIRRGMVEASTIGTTDINPMIARRIDPAWDGRGFRG